MLRRTFLSSLSAPGLVLAQPLAPVIERAWFGPADRSHGHDALGTGRYPGRIGATVSVNGRRSELALELPRETAFEDGAVRLVDLVADRTPEILVVRASRSGGAALSIIGIDPHANGPALLELARSPSVGTGRWLNPVGAADFDGDGRQEVVAVVTPHIGGVLTLYGYRPPDLVPLAREHDVSNHAYGQHEQQLAAIVVRAGRRTVAVPDQRRRRLRFLSPTHRGQWESVAPDVSFDGPIERVWTSDGARVHVQTAMQVHLVD